MASSRPFQRKSTRGQKGTILTEVVVIQGKVDGSYQSSRSIPSDDELEGSIEVHSKHLQICKQTLKGCGNSRACKLLFSTFKYFVFTRYKV